MGLWYSAAERRQSVAPGVSPGLVSFWHTSPVGAKESFAPTGLRSSRKKTPGLRPGLHSVAAPRLSMAAHFGQLSPTAVMSRSQKTFSPVDLRTTECIAGGHRPPLQLPARDSSNDKLSAAFCK